MQLQFNKQFVFQTINIGMTSALPMKSQKDILDQLNQENFQNCSSMYPKSSRSFKSITKIESYAQIKIDI